MENASRKELQGRSAGNRETAMDALEQKVEERTEQLAETVNKLLAANKNLEREIRDRRAAEQALNKKKEELLIALEREKSLGELKSRFVVLASHEFRTPLSAILSSAALVKRYADIGNREKLEFHIEKIRSSVHHMTGILNDFISLTKLEEGRVENNPQHFDALEFCHETAEELRGLAKTGQEIVVTGNADRAPVFLDRFILKNILCNLISNALKYSQAEVQCSVELRGSQLEIKVADQGIGIPQAEQKHLFERFYRARNAAHIQGTGLGLNIVKRYTDMLGGSVTFASAENQGTVFTLQLPQTVL